MPLHRIREDLRFRGRRGEGGGAMSADTRPQAPASPHGVGARIPKRDAPSIVTGSLRYATDVALPGTLVCKVLRSAWPHAGIVSIDTSAAAAMSGVRAVITGKDVPHNRTGVSVSDRPILAVDKVRYYGDPVAAVAADTDEIARAALEKIRVDYDPLPALRTLDEALAPDAPLVHEDMRPYAFRGFVKPHPVYEPNNVSTRFVLKSGDTAAGRGRAAVVVRDVFQTQWQEHVSMEPHVAMAQYDAATERLTLWSSTGKPFRTLIQTAPVLGIPHSRVHLVQLPTGGDFGGKGEPTLEPIVALLAMKAGRPVKGVYTREEEFLASTIRVPFTMDLEIGAGAGGDLTHMDCKITVDTGPYNGMAAEVAMWAAVSLQGPYRVRDIDATAECIYTNNLLGGSYRGFGNPQISFARETLLDEIASRLGRDPLELRLQNAWEYGSVTCTGQVLDPAKFAIAAKETLQVAADACDWRAARAQSKRAGRYRRGIGLATMFHGITGAIFAGADTSTIHLHANMDGTVTMVTGTAEIGQGSDTTLSQIVAEELRIPISMINLSAKDTASVPYEGGSSASRVLYLSGNSARSAGQEMAQRLRELAADLLESAPDDIELGDAKAWVRGAPGKALGYGALVSHAISDLGFQPVSTGTFRRPVLKLDERGQGEPFPAFSFATQAAEVEVDTWTGRVRVMKFWAAHDVGRAINPMIVEGQIEGALGQGLGFALTEEVVTDDCQALNASLADYHIPASVDMPPVETIIVEVPEPSGAYGAKGVGEPGLVPTAAAIANAIYDATGVRPNTLPMTPERIYNALRAAGVS
jgi:carbon-monoxide dehydrogenase large subunit